MGDALGGPELTLSLISDGLIQDKGPAKHYIIEVRITVRVRMARVGARLQPGLEAKPRIKKSIEPCNLPP